MPDYQYPISDSRLTIGFLRRGYSPTGGVEAYLKGLAEGLRGERHRVVLLGTSEWPESAWPGGEILRCKGSTLSEYSKEVARQKLGSGIRFDLILSVEKVPGCELYRTDEGLHAAWLEQRSRYISPWARLFQRISPKHREKLRLEKQLFTPEATRRVISLSHKISREIGEYYDYPQKQITLIRNGVPTRSSTTPEERALARRELGIPEDEKIALFVGTGWERKGLRFAIRAVEALNDPRVKLLVAGSGSQKRYASPSVRFLGGAQKMPMVYDSADLFLFPTLFDPFPLATLEALSAGLPVITTAANGVSEIMTPGDHGEVISESSDIAALESALGKWLEIVADSFAGSKARAACSKLASEFTLERNLKETLGVIRMVISERE
jgi:UDP-glucose:(heptosyl)LPS alpha-1,3-glucosyltransferase